MIPLEDILANHSRVFPITDTLLIVLDEQKAQTRELKRTYGIIPWVFHHKGKPIRQPKRAWKKACKKAGVPGKLFHDFRRTALLNLAGAEIPERVAMQMTGHQTRSVFDCYNIVFEGDLFEAARKLDAAADTVTDTVEGLEGNQRKPEIQQVAHNQHLTKCAPVAQ